MFEKLDLWNKSENDPHYLCVITCNGTVRQHPQWILLALSNAGPVSTVPRKRLVTEDISKYYIVSNETVQKHKFDAKTLGYPIAESEIVIYN